MKKIILTAAICLLIGAFIGFWATIKTGIPNEHSFIVFGNEFIYE